MASFLNSIVPYLFSFYFRDAEIIQLVTIVTDVKKAMLVMPQVVDVFLLAVIVIFPVNVIQLEVFLQVLQ